MACSWFFLLMTALVSITKIGALDCSEVSSVYWCHNTDSAEICEKSQYCQNVWRNREAGTDVGGIGTPPTAQQMSNPSSLRNSAGPCAPQSSSVKIFCEELLKRMYRWSRVSQLPNGAIQSYQPIFKMCEQRTTSERTNIGSSASTEKSSGKLFRNFNDTDSPSLAEVFREMGFRFVNQPADIEKTSDDFFRRVHDWPHTAVTKAPTTHRIWNSQNNHEYVKSPHVINHRTVSHAPFANTIIILSGMAGVLASTWNLSSTMAPRNDINVYYHCPECQVGDDLTVFEDGMVEFFASVTHVTDFIETGVKPTAYRLMPQEYTQYSMVFPSLYAEIHRDGQIVSTTLSMNVTNWMEQLRASLEHLTIADLFIPGTHQSAAYQPKGPQPPLETLTSRWVLCQNTTILEQLYNGIRYLDIRVRCVMENGNCQYYAHHGNVKTMPMRVIVDELNYFLTHTQEIVILAFKEFTVGFDSDEDHKRFIQYLWHEFRQHLFPATDDPWSTPLSVFWYRNRRLIVSYDHTTYQSHQLWPRIEQRWCDKRSVQELYECLGMRHRQHRTSRPVADMAQLTHDWKSVVADAMPWTSDDSVRSWAERVSPYLLKWYYEEWHSTTNIVAVDFFEITGIVDLAIHMNVRRAQKRKALEGGTMRGTW